MRCCGYKWHRPIVYYANSTTEKNELKANIIHMTRARACKRRVHAVHRPRYSAHKHAAHSIAQARYVEVAVYLRFRDILYTIHACCMHKERALFNCTLRCIYANARLCHAHLCNYRVSDTNICICVWVCLTDCSYMTTSIHTHYMQY